MPRLDNLTLRERVHEHLKGEILANRYAPGSELLEVPLSEELGVSRGPIREALRSLESEGLVEITPRRGAFVTSLSKRDFLEAYQVREALEALGVRLAVPRLTEAGLDALEVRLDEMAEHAAAGDVDAFFEANAGFHEAFMEASENRSSSRSIGASWPRWGRTADHQPDCAAMSSGPSRSIATSWWLRGPVMSRLPWHG
jgi:DNA-binding GntR family transcriptional regulator